MISFTLITSTPTVLRDQLIARDVIKQVTQEGDTVLVGVREGVEWLEVPNPIVTTLAVGNPGDVGYVPPVMDMRHCYLVKLVRTAEANEEAGIDQSSGTLWQKTKLGQWILANSVSDTLVSADGRSWPSLRVGTNFWGVISDNFGTWQ